MNSKRFLVTWLIIATFCLSAIGILVYDTDPFFHYHYPKIEKYFYELNNQRSQNDGIIKHFSYDALITGTSMTENFKTSDMNDIFECNSIKVPFSGGTYKEINDAIELAMKENKNIKYVVRCLDVYRFFDDKNLMRLDLGSYPTYLYDNNLLNDVKYMFNKDVIFQRSYVMFKERMIENKKGIESFDGYSNWMNHYKFGRKSVIPNGIDVSKQDEYDHLTAEEKEVIFNNIKFNVTDTADSNPDVNFYYFISPYSVVYWGEKINDGSIYKQIEAEKYIIELILPHKNIHLYSFNTINDMITDLNNYKDNTHYGEWINTQILKWMKNNDYLLTENNYEEYISKELDLYINFDYSSLNNQIDYADDYFIASKYTN